MVNRECVDKEKISKLEKKISELEYIISKQKVQLDVANMENEYMKNNMKLKNKQLKKFRKNKLYKIYRLYVRTKNKIMFWRKKVEKDSSNS